MVLKLLRRHRKRSVGVVILWLLGMRIVTRILLVPRRRLHRHQRIGWTTTKWRLGVKRSLVGVGVSCVVALDRTRRICEQCSNGTFSHTDILADTYFYALVGKGAGERRRL